jgi:hypothetical protein
VFSTKEIPGPVPDFLPCLEHFVTKTGQLAHYRLDGLTE